MVITGSRLLTTARINRIIRTLAMDLEAARPLTFLERTPIVEAEDGELTGKFTGKVIAADLITDDHQAVVYEGGKVELSRNEAPNIKIGQRLSQQTINMLRRIENNPGIQGENAFRDWQNALAANLLLGVRMRMNALICAATLDSLSYNRLGVQVTAGWGKPAGLKANAAVVWTTYATADPIADIQALVDYAVDNYGIRYNRITMSTTALRHALKCDSFLNAAAAHIAYPGTAAHLGGLPGERKKEIFGELLGMEIVLEDATYTEVSGAGVQTSTRYMPATKVILDRKENDNDPAVMDFANGVVTESVVSQLIFGAPDVGGEQSGPVGYYTGKIDLNPPDLTAWAVARGFPRYNTPEAAAVLTAY